MASQKLLHGFLDSAGQRLSTIAMKSFYAHHLRAFMVPDIFSFHDSLPETSTGKIDYQQLKQM